MQTFEYRAGTTPLLVSMPHRGTAIPDDLATRMIDIAVTVPDTDWHVDRLYDFAAELGAAALTPRYSRYVIDLNRAPDNRALYAGARNTELCPTTTFHDQPLYRDGEQPDQTEIAELLGKVCDLTDEVEGLGAKLSKADDDHSSLSSAIVDLRGENARLTRVLEGLRMRFRSVSEPVIIDPEQCEVILKSIREGLAC